MCLTHTSDFQLTYAHNAWLEERAGWRTVIYLNLVRSVNQILDILTAEMTSQNILPTPTTPVSPLSPSWTSTYSSPSSSSSHFQEATLDDGGITHVDRPHFTFTDRHKMLRMRLAPLRSVQHDLEVQIGAGSTDFDVSPISTTYSAPPSPHPSSSHSPTLNNPRKINEFYIHSSSGWKETLSKLRPRLSVNTSLDVYKRKSTRTKENQKQMEAVEVIAGCGADIQMLWEDSVVRAMLNSKDVKLDEAPGL